MQGVTTNFSQPKNNTVCTTALKKKPDTRGYAPYLLDILVILFHPTLARYNLLTTSGQSLSAAKITRPRYYKEVTIFRGRP